MKRMIILSCSVWRGGRWGRVRIDLPCIIYWGAQSSTNVVSSSFITQWYLNFSGSVQRWILAITVQFFIFALSSIALLFCGHKLTVSAVLCDHWQNLLQSTWMIYNDLIWNIHGITCTVKLSIYAFICKYPSFYSNKKMTKNILKMFKYLLLELVIWKGYKYMYKDSSLISK